MPDRYERPQPYEELDHTADAGVVVRGASAEEAMARLVLAFTELVTGGGPLESSGSLTLGVEAGDCASMGVDLLRELLYRLERDRVLPVSCEVLELDPQRGTRVRVETGRYDEEAHREGTTLKAVTLHEARFERSDGGWLARVVFDV